MPIAGSDISLVFQGPIFFGATDTAELIRKTRQAFPDSPCLLSTWTGSDAAGIPVDRVMLSEDPGAWPCIKRKGPAGELNNINRQILSTRRGLSRVETPYAIKLRTDCALSHARLLDIFERFQSGRGIPRTVVSSMFTIDPTMFEQMPYHISDWFQFGRTCVLQNYWSAPYMTGEDATYYEARPYADHSTFMDRRFRCRLAVEQFLAAHHAARLGYPTPRYHNDVRPHILAGHKRFVIEHFVVVDPWDIGLMFPKYEWAYRSAFQRLNCLLFIDWYELYRQQGGPPIEPEPGMSALSSRRTAKRVGRLLGRCMDKAGPLLLRPRWKRVANGLLAALDRQRNTPRMSG